MDLEKRFELERELTDKSIATVVANEKSEHTRTRAAIAVASLPTWGPILVSGLGSLVGVIAAGLHWF
jgi:hypothetical protein